MLTSLRAERAPKTHALALVGVLITGCDAEELQPDQARLTPEHVPPPAAFVSSEADIVFNEHAYLVAFPDVAAAVRAASPVVHASPPPDAQSGYLHYVHQGYKESCPQSGCATLPDGTVLVDQRTDGTTGKHWGRLARKEYVAALEAVTASYDDALYLKSFSDISLLTPPRGTQFQVGFAHYNPYGRNENRLAHTSYVSNRALFAKAYADGFVEEAYLVAFADIANVTLGTGSGSGVIFSSPLQHYVPWGEAEKRLQFPTYWNALRKLPEKLPPTYTFASDARSIEWTFVTGPDQGIGRVFVDGVSRGDLDLYAPARGTKTVTYWVWEPRSTPHTFTVRHTLRKHGASSGYGVNLGAPPVKGPSSVPLKTAKTAAGTQSIYPSMANQHLMDVGPMTADTNASGYAAVAYHHTHTEGTIMTWHHRVRVTKVAPLGPFTETLGTDTPLVGIYPDAAIDDQGNVSLVYMSGWVQPAHHTQHQAPSVFAAQHVGDQAAGAPIVLKRFADGKVESLQVAAKGVRPAIAADPAGHELVVAWEQGSGSARSVVARRVSVSPIGKLALAGSEVAVTPVGREPRVAMSSGHFAVTWTQSDTTSPQVHLFASAGSRLHTAQLSASARARVGMDAAGNYFAAYQESAGNVRLLRNTNWNTAPKPASLHTFSGGYELVDMSVARDGTVALAVTRFGTPSILIVDGSAQVLGAPTRQFRPPAAPSTVGASSQGTFTLWHTPKPNVSIGTYTVATGLRMGHVAAFDPSGATL